MKLRTFAIVVITSSFFGCKSINVIKHQKPEMKVDFSPFENAGCLPREGSIYYCDKESNLYNLGCDQIKPASDLLGGFDPPLPIAVCLYLPLEHGEQGNLYDLPEGEYFYNAGGLYPILQRYIILKDDEFLVVKYLGDLQNFFAPIESKNEALSFTLAAKRIFAAYDQKVNKDYEYYVDTLEDSFVEEIDGGYLVHAFAYNFYGCGYHYTYAIEINVDLLGNMDEINRSEIFKDPDEDDLCRD